MHYFHAVAFTLPAFVATQAFGHDHGHAGDIVVGITGPTAQSASQLAFEGDFDEPVLLSPVSGPLSGWTASSPGFGHLSANEDHALFFTLAPGASVRLEVVSIDVGLAVVQAGFGAIADATGESILLGDDELHSHPTWYVQSNILGAQWTGTLTGTFRLIDTGTTAYAASNPFTLTFTNVPEPASLALLALAALVISRPRKP